MSEHCDEFRESARTSAMHLLNRLAPMDEPSELKSLDLLDVKEVCMFVLSLPDDGQSAVSQPTKAADLLSLLFRVSILNLAATIGREVPDYSSLMPSITKLMADIESALEAGRRA
jgi:hypothetical protein